MKRVLFTIAWLALASCWPLHAEAQQAAERAGAAALMPPRPRAVAPPIRLEMDEPELPREDRRSRPERREPGLGYGLQATGGYAADHALSIYGLNGIVRYSFLAYLALELDFGINGGGDNALLVPISLNGLAFLHLRGRLHPYLIWGANLTVLEQFTGEPTGFFGGAHLGIGVESMLSRRTGLSLDLRGFFLERLAHDDSSLEYGVTLNYGVVFYR